MLNRTAPRVYGRQPRLSGAGTDAGTDTDTGTGAGTDTSAPLNFHVVAPKNHA